LYIWEIFPIIEIFREKIMKTRIYSIGLLFVALLMLFSSSLNARESVETEASWLAGAKQAIRNMEYQVSFQKQSMIPGDKPAWHITNRAQNLRLYVHPGATKIIRRTDESPEWILCLGTPSSAGELFSPEKYVVSGKDKTITRKGQGLCETYHNDEKGILHTILLANSPPPGETVVHIKMDITGDLQPVISNDNIEFLNDGSSVVSYGNLQAVDARGNVLDTNLKISSGEIIIEIKSDAFVYPVKFSADLKLPSTAPGITLSLEQDFAGFGWSVATAGDVNGDGYSEVIVGAPYFDDGQNDEGAAFLYRGTGDGLEKIPVWKREGEQAGAHMGWSVATAGDVNGDGYWDVIMGAPTYDFSFAVENIGKVEVYHGSAEGLQETAAWSRMGSIKEDRFGWSVASAGDVNRDGYSDVIVGVPYQFDEFNEEGAAYVFKGTDEGILGSEPWWSAAPADQAFARFGHSVACAGDVNADGFDDIIIGAPQFSSSHSFEGGAWVYPGGPEGPGNAQIWFRVSNELNARFGYSVASAGDVNGDGHSDIIVGAPRHKGGFSWEAGRAFLFYGHSTGVNLSSDWEGSTYTYQINSHYGSSVAGAGDVNGDGYGDILIGIPDDGSKDTPGVGRAHLYYGSSTGLETIQDWNGAPSEPSPDQKSFYGYSVACAGDINGDGYSDIIVGAPYEPETAEIQPLDEGFAYVYYGAPDEPGDDPLKTYQSDQANAALGTALASAGDVNGDGYDDILIAAPYFDKGHVDEGCIYLWLGGSGGPGLTPVWYAEGNEIEVRLGWSVASAGDVNGDGYDDIIAGCPRSNPLYISAGRAYTWYGGAAGMGDPGSPDNADWKTAGLKEGALVGSSVACAGDVNGDGFCDVIVGASGENTARLFRGSSAGLDTTPSWEYSEAKAGSAFGWSVASAGDVNRDGYFDIIVGAPFYTPTSNTNDFQKGLARAFYGSSAGLNKQSEWMAVGPGKSNMFGYCVSTGGDMDGDGFSEIIVGAPGVAKVHFYHGGPNGPVSLKPGDTIYNVHDVYTSLLGFSVACAGDIDGDGRADVILGAPYDIASGGAGSNRGTVTVIYRYTRDAGFPTKVFNGSMDGGVLGWCVSGAGDVNGDGYADFLMGSPGYSDGEVAEGAAFLFSGNGRRSMAVLPVQMNSGGIVPIAHRCASDSTMDFCLGLHARTPFGRSKVRMELEVKYLDQIFNGQNLFETGLWQDTYDSGNIIRQELTDPSNGQPYHWRGRILYKPGNIFGLTHSRWITRPLNGMNEMDFRTKPPSPIPGTGLFLY
jgi:FG-GAP repeat protein/VCBS repeat protein